MNKPQGLYTYKCEYCGKQNTVKLWPSYKSTGKYPKYCNQECYMSSDQWANRPLKVPVEAKRAYELYYGNYHATYRSVGEELGCSHEWARTLINKHRETLRTGTKNSIDKL